MSPKIIKLSILQTQVNAQATVSLEAQQAFAANLLPTRAQHMNSLQEKHFDILVIGGGATGSGVALDAVSRGSYNSISVDRNL